MIPESPFKRNANMGYDLRCTACGDIKEYGETGHCEVCGGILECIHSKDALITLREERNEPGLARFAPVLPVEKGFLPYLGECQTPLLPSKFISKKLKLAYLYFKAETQNPTGSFKDRGTSVSIGMARKMKSKGMMTVSSGNGAASLATYAAACQLPCLVLVDSEASTEKLRQIITMGAKCIKVEGIFERGFEHLYEVVVEISRSLAYWCAFSWAPVNPYSVEGTKTIAYECARITPDVVICPVAGGDNLAGQWKGYKELHEAGIIAKRPKMIAVQPEGSSPLVLAYTKRSRHVSPITKARTVASGLKTTFSGDHALTAIYESEGCAIEVDDEEILKQKDLLAQSEGIWVESSSAVTLAALPKLIESGIVNAEEKVICVLTGAGYKERIERDSDRRIEFADLNPDDVIKKYRQLTG
jgi:threonine synthase